MARRNKRKIHGFTLIEVLVAMSILVVIMTMMARIFTDLTTTWQIGTRRIAAASEGRVIMQFLAREISMAIADETVTFRVDNNAPAFYGASSSEINFLGLNRQSSTDFRRAGTQFAYFIDQMVDRNDNPLPNRFRLVRTRRTGSMYETNQNRANSAYRRSDWWQTMGTQPIEVIADNIASFQVFAYCETAGDYVDNYTSSTRDDRLPLWVDIYVEMLDPATAERVALLWVPNNDEARRLLESNVRRYVTRVHFPKRLSRQ